MILQQKEKAVSYLCETLKSNENTFCELNWVLFPITIMNFISAAQIQQ